MPARGSSLPLPEKELKATLDPGVAAVLAPKRVLLMKRIAAELKWPDFDLFDQMLQGFDLVGVRGPSGVFRTDVRPAAQSASELEERLPWLKEMLLTKVRASGLNDDSRTLWDLTLSESEAGILEGPHGVEHFDSKYPQGWLPVRRFGIWQSSGGKDKFRPIEDFAESELNSAFAYCDKLDLRALDQLVAMIRWWVQVTRGGGRVSVELSDGSRLEGNVHSSWKTEEASAPHLTTLDLRNAYKQLALSPQSRRLAVTSLLCPETGNIACFESQALPFGALSSVVDFNSCVG